MMEKQSIISKFIYGGRDKEFFRSHEAELSRQNSRIIGLFITIVTFGYFVYSLYAIHAAVSPVIKVVYISGLLLFALLLAGYNRWGRTSTKLIRLYYYLVFGLLFAVLGYYNAVDLKGYSVFIPIMIFLSFGLSLEPFHYTCIYTGFLTLAYVIAVCKLKTGDPLIFDLVDCGICFILGVVLGNGLLRERLNAIAYSEAEIKLKMAEYDRIIDTLAKDYSGVNYVELSENKLDDIGISYRTSELLKKLGPEVNDEMKFSDKMDLLLERGVYEPDKEQFARDTRRETILAELADADTYAVYPRFMIEGEIRYYEMKFSAIRENGKLVAVVAGLRSIDEERKREMRNEESRRLIESVASSYSVAMKVNLADDSIDFLRVEPQFVERSRITDLGTFSEVKASLSGFLHPGDRDRVLRELDRDVIRRNIGSSYSYNMEYRVLINGGTAWHELNVTKIDENEVAVGFKENDREIIGRRIEQKHSEEFFALFVVDIDTGMLKVIKNEERFRAAEVGASVPYTDYIRALAQPFDDEAKAFFLQLSDLEYVKKEFAADDKRTYAYKSPNLIGEKWIEVTAYCIRRHDDGSPAMIALGWSLEDALAAAREEFRLRLETALDAADAASRAKTEFLFNMSHDIRTPMNAITGFTNMAIKHIDDREKVLDCLEKTQKSSGMLLSLINSVLEVSRIESGHAVLEEQPGDVYLSFSNIENTMRETAKTKDIDLFFEFGEIRDRYVYADFTRCMRVFVNVISNAVKYTPDGGTVRVSCTQLAEAPEGYGTYEYVFTDNGIGMSEEFQKHIFEEFTRENTSTTSGIQGTGLGMAVVKSFVELMGGTVSVRSKQGEGTEVRIVLPFRLQQGEAFTDPETGTVVSADTEVRKAEHVDFTGRRVLLVDDNELNREIAAELLEDAGLLVEEADDGSTAVDIMKEKGPGAYDFILMDIQMPVMNGLEAAKAIREMYPDAKIPIVALSANAFAEDKAASLAAGMNDHVAKPINIQELFSSLAKFL